MGAGETFENTGQDATGRAREAAGAVSGGDELQGEGQRDRLAAAVKDAAKSVKDRAAESADSIKEKVDRT